jgi:hypothetical protein
MDTERGNVADSFGKWWVYSVCILVIAAGVAFLVLLWAGQIPSQLAVGLCIVVAPAYGVIAWILKTVFDIKDAVARIEERLASPGK